MKHPDMYPGANLLTTGMYSIFRLSIEDNNRAALGEAGACDTATRLLASHGRGYEKVALYGLAAVSSLAYNSPTNRQRLLDAGACDQVRGKGVVRPGARKRGVRPGARGKGRATRSEGEMDYLR